MRKVFIFLGLLTTLPTVAEVVEDIHWGMDVEENVSFATAKECDKIVREALQANGFIPKKTGDYEQGPTVFSATENQEWKSVVKCMLSYDLVITTVIGLKENLQKAEQINDKIKALQQAKSNPAKTPQVEEITEKVVIADEKNQKQPETKQKQPINYFGKQKSISAPKGYKVLAAPTLAAEVLKEETRTSTIGAVGYIETAEGKFYISEYSWNQYQAGKDSNWIYIIPNESKSK